MDEPGKKQKQKMTTIAMGNSITLLPLGMDAIIIFMIIVLFSFFSFE